MHINYKTDRCVTSLREFSYEKIFEKLQLSTLEEKEKIYHHVQMH